MHAKIQNQSKISKSSKITREFCFKKQENGKIVKLCQISKLVLGFMRKNQPATMFILKLDKK